TITPVKCTGETNGAISLMPSGGTAPYTYAWSGPNGFTSTNNNLTNLDNGTYVVTVTDNKGCILISQQLNVTEAAALLTPTFNTSSNVKCFGENNGSIQISVTGGQAPLQYSWRDFNNLQVSTLEDPSNLVAGIYNVIVTDAFGCTKSLSSAVTITAPPTALTVNSLITNVVCNGGSTGAISLTISGGWPGSNTITWSPNLPANNPNPTNIPANTYTASVTDGGGCVVTHVAQVTQPAAILFDTVITPQSGVALDGAIDLTILSGGVAPLAYAWTGPNGYSAITQDITGLAAGMYTVTVTDATSCQLVVPFSVPSDNVASVLSVVDACGNNGCINLLLTNVAVPPFIITLTSSVLPGGTKEVLTSDATPELCDLPAGFYNINIADGNSNVYNIGAVQILQLEQALVSEQTTNPTGLNNNGSIILTHSFQSNFDFVWSTGSVDSVLTGLAAGTYTVTVTNASSLCTAVYSYTLTLNNPLLVTSTQQNPNCILSATGSINLAVNGGTPPYIFSWTGPNGFTAATQNLTGVLAGTYSVTVSDQGGTLFDDDYTLTANSLLAISTVDETSNYGFGFQVSSADACDGVANVVVANAVGNVSILWSTGETGFSASALCGGAYTVTVSDQSGCTSVWSDNLLAPGIISGTSTQLSNYNGYGVSCFESCDGSVRFFPAGGVPPYTVSWPTGQIDQNIPAGGASVAEELCGGNLLVTITDFLGATKVVTITLLQPDPLEVEFSVIPPTTFNSCDGEILAVVPGAVGQFTATWSGSFGSAGTGQRAEDLCAGEVVQFIIEDANGCTAIGVDTLFSKDIDCMSLRPVITPGLQDGKNDYLLITCAESTKNHIEIYNRWGQLVFETDNYDNSSRVWTGLTDSGKPLAEGVYYYVLTYTGAGGEDVVTKGHINLLR
ncbi:MAG: gliding motility-associated C-terminal domain-containing protein, partial [Saprospiraceae bacterium]|nr:gliding motility-associated C-terminal domain-containing protein [Saprospiraceae bacterium]